MKFAVETKLGAEELNAYHRITGKSVLWFKLTLIQVSLLVVGTVAVIAGMASLAEVGFAIMPIVCVAAGIVMLVLDMNYYRYLTWKTGLRLGYGMEQQFFFEDDRLVAQTKVERVLHNYSDFKAVVEAQDYYALFLNKHFGYLLPKKGFFQGDPAEFSAFLEAKTGKRVRIVKIRSGGKTHA